MVENNKPDLPTLNYLTPLLNLWGLYLLITSIMLFDSLAISLYKEGIITINYSSFLTSERIPFILLFLVILGVTLTVFASAIYWLFGYLYDGFILKIFQKIKGTNLGKFLFADSEKERKQADIDKDFKDVFLLHKQAIMERDSFLMNYVNKFYENREVEWRNIRIIYAALISILANLFISIFSNGTITRFIISLFYDTSFGTKLLTGVTVAAIILPIVRLICLSVKNNDNKIYDPVK